MEPFELYHHYRQNLLLAQHQVSEIIKHSLTRGEVREDFIINYLTNCINDCDRYLKRGFIALAGSELSGQADIILLKKYAEAIDFGNTGNVIVYPNDCLMVIEVKSTLTGNYLNSFNTEAQKIKESNPDIVCGMFAYKTSLTKKTIMNRCGHDFDASTRTYYDSRKVPSPIYYPFIDFILLLDKAEEYELEEGLELQGGKQLFLRKSNQFDARYFKGTFDPVVRNLVGLVRSLLIG